MRASLKLLMWPALSERLKTPGTRRLRCLIFAVAVIVSGLLGTLIVTVSGSAVTNDEFVKG
jgi:hypothetical protein